MKLVVYSPRWGHNDTYDVQRTATGWKITFHPKGGDCDTLGRPHLFEIFQNDSVPYPHEFGRYMKHLWKKAQELCMSDGEIQEHLDELGIWLQDIAKSEPKGEFWSGAP